MNDLERLKYVLGWIPKGIWAYISVREESGWQKWYIHYEGIEELYFGWRVS